MARRSRRTIGLPLLALEHALPGADATRGRQRPVRHSDRGSRYVPLTYSDALIDTRGRTFVRTMGDSDDSVLSVWRS